MLKVIAEHVAVKRLVNTGTADQPSWRLEYVPVVKRMTL
jgi:hypothetical protein